MDFGGVVDSPPGGCEGAHTPISLTCVLNKAMMRVVNIHCSKQEQGNSQANIDFEGVIDSPLSGSEGANHENAQTQASCG